MGLAYINFSNTEWQNFSDFLIISRYYFHVFPGLQVLGGGGRFAGMRNCRMHLTDHPTEGMV
jgi:hypothetical protein